MLLTLFILFVSYEFFLASIGVIPQIRCSCGHRKAARDTHLSCLSCCNCSVENKCLICSNSSQTTWFKAIFRRRFAEKMVKNAKQMWHSPSPSGALSEEDNSVAGQGSSGDEASLKDVSLLTVERSPGRINRTPG